MKDWTAIINGINVARCGVEIKGSDSGTITIHLPPHAEHTEELQALQTDRTQRHFETEIDCDGYTHAKFLKCFLDRISTDSRLSIQNPEGGRDPGLKLVIEYCSE